MAGGGRQSRGRRGRKKMPFMEIDEDRSEQLVHQNKLAFHKD
jgi:hypothetical protein